MTKTKISIILVCLLIITFLYFSVPLFFYPDSLSYYSNLRVLQGVHPISAWETFRGPSLSLFFLPFSFGWINPNFNLLVSTYLLFLGLLVISYKVIDDSISLFKSGNIKKLVVWFIFLLFIVFNPLLFGYFHSFLTEPVAIFIGLFSSYLSWKWIEVSFEDNKRKYFLYVFIFIILVVFSWFLKQPYLSVAMSPILIASLISMISERSLKNILQRILTIVILSISLLLSISWWDSFLIQNGAGRSGSEYNQMFFSSSIISGVSNLRLMDRDSFPEDNFLDDPFLKDFDKSRIASILEGKSEGKFRVYTVLSTSGEIKDRLVFYYEGKDFSSSESFVFLLSLIRRYPLVVADSYFSNYLGAINVYRTEDTFYTTVPIKEYNESSRENISIGLAFFHNDKNILWMGQEQRGLLKEFSLPNDSGVFSDQSKQVISDFYLNSFKLVFLSLPILLVYTVIRSLRFINCKDKKETRYYIMILILLGSSFLHALSHTLTASIIDRYFFIVFPQIILAIILLIIVHKGGLSGMKKVRRLFRSFSK